MSTHRDDRNTSSRPGQPEGIDWRSAVQRYVSEHPKARAMDIAAALGCTEAQALGALSNTAWEIPGSDLPQILTEIQAWEQIMVLVRNQDAVAEVEVRGDAGQVNGDWLNWIETGYNLHIRITATHHILALIRPGKRGPTFSFNLVNQKGLVLCRFYTRTSAARERFLAFCERYNTLEG